MVVHKPQRFFYGRSRVRMLCGVVVRVLGISAVAVFGFFMVGGFRSWTCGVSAGGIVTGVCVAGLMVGPPALVCLLGVPRRWTVTILVCVVGLCVVAAEVWMYREEAAILARYGRESEKEIIVQRAWPFDGSSLVFVPGTGWRAQD